VTAIDALRAAVDIFYEKLTGDEQLKKFFEDISVARLKVHQFNFLRFAFTEIPKDMDVYQYMIDKHKRLFNEKGLNETHFDLVAGHLVATLQQLNVPEPLIAEVVGIVGPLRSAFADEAARIANAN
jgi:hemoglobin